MRKIAYITVGTAVAATLAYGAYAALQMGEQWEADCKASGGTVQNATQVGMYLNPATGKMQMGQEITTWCEGVPSLGTLVVYVF